MNSVSEILGQASAALNELNGETLDLIQLGRPDSTEAAVEHSKIISKLSPLVGNLLEIKIADYLNSSPIFSGASGKWRRQDPGFPDVIYDGLTPNPGIEIKAWYPFSTEITGRFKDSQRALSDNNINLAVIAWVPDKILFGRPKIISIEIIPALSIAEYRDSHYQNPPDYIVLEPEDTSNRTRNLQQSNTNGYKFQGTRHQAEEASSLYERLIDRKEFNSFDPSYQSILKSIQGKYSYRLDTNFAKIDRIQHPDLENFKRKILKTSIAGYDISFWGKLLRNEKSLAEFLGDGSLIQRL